MHYVAMPARERNTPMVGPTTDNRASRVGRARGPYRHCGVTLNFMSFGVLFAILIPIAEVWAAIQVAHHIGWLATIALLVLISACGPALVRRQGIGVWHRAQRRIEEGEVPGREAIDGVLLLIAGGLLTFPGFITGVFGLLLLLPPVRKLVRVTSGAWLARKVRKSTMVRVSLRGRQASRGAGAASDRGSGVVDAGSYRIPTAASTIEGPRGALGAPTETDPTNAG